MGTQRAPFLHVSGCLCFELRAPEKIAAFFAFSEGFCLFWVGVLFLFLLESKAPTFIVLLSAHSSLFF